MSFFKKEHVNEGNHFNSLFLAESECKNLNVGRKQIENLCQYRFWIKYDFRNQILKSCMYILSTYTPSSNIFQRVAWLMITSQIIITSVSVCIFTISREVSYAVETCRGRKEIFYSFAYFDVSRGNFSLVTNVCSSFLSYSNFSYYGSHILKIFHLLSMINIFDILIIFRIAISVKSQTLSVTSLLTSKALKQRKR